MRHLVVFFVMCKVRLTTSFTGSSGMVSSVSASRSLSFSTKENQSFSDCLKSGSCTARPCVSALDKVMVIVLHSVRESASAGRHGIEDVLGSA